ncbi:glycosyltransferase, partial [bacterium]|nr:glycosyltransferase [bacterium]
VAVRAFAHIAAARPARLLRAGTGPELASTLALAAGLGLADKVVSLGLEVGIEGLYPDADLLISPSDHESFGLAILEALSCGVPVAATDVGGVSEVVGPEGGHARLAPAGDHAALGEAGLALLEDGDREAARERAMLFPPERSVAGYEAVYRGQPVPAWPGR